MNPESVATASAGVVETLLNAGVLGAGILVLLAFVAKLYVDKRNDAREHAAALAKLNEQHAAELKAANKQAVALALRHAGAKLEREGAA